MPSPKWQGIFEVWKGGLGVWGGILLGALAGACVIRRSGASVALFMDAAAPGLLLAQGIGRIGNWWNQELFGKPTKLPWGAQDRLAHRPPRTSTSATFHPTFLYELIWDVVGVLRPALRRPALPDPAARPLRAICRLVHVRPLLRGAAADRPGPSHRRPAPERVGLDRPLRRLAAFFVWLQSRPGADPRGNASIRAARERRSGAGDGDPEEPRPVARSTLGAMAVPVRELELDLDAFEGPFDLLLSLVLREELPLREVDLAEIVIAFVEHLAERASSTSTPAASS